MKEKSAQDFMESMRRGVSQVPGMASQAGGAIKDWYKNLNPDARNAVMRGLMGAGIGAGVTGGLSALSPHDPEEKRPIMGPALIGALMGGGAAAGIPYGLKLLANKAQLPGEESRPLGANILEKATGPIFTHPATTAGAALGGGALYAAGRKVKGEKPGTYVQSELGRTWESTKAPVVSKPSIVELANKLKTMYHGEKGELETMWELASRSPSELLSLTVHEDPTIRNVAKTILSNKAKQLANPQTYTSAARKAPGQITRGALDLTRRIRDTWRAKPAGRASMLAIPGGMAAGALLDRYLKGEY